MASNNNESCRTYIACPTSQPVQLGETNFLVLEVPCVSTENVAITQNKTQLAACRDDSSAVDNVEGTAFNGTGQIELKDRVSEAFAELLYTKACTCTPVCFLFLTPTVPVTSLPVPDNFLNSQNSEFMDGLFICGVPDANWTRDQSGKSLSYTVTPTVDSGKYSTFLDRVSVTLFQVDSAREVDLSIF